MTGFGAREPDASVPSLCASLGAGVRLSTQPIPGGLAVGLKPFPGLPHPNIEIVAEASRLSSGILRLWFTLRGDIDVVSYPTTAAPERTDGLWQHTCFEAFVAGEGPAYREYNLSPSGAWAAYRFDGYREGMTEAELEPPVVNLAGIAGHTSIGADLASSDLPYGAWRLGISAVIEDRAGVRSYWALTHPTTKPDFHHPDCFALELPASRPA